MRMKVHADVLRMAATEERRELIKWYLARKVFFNWEKPSSFIDGLALARECHHPDARFLVSLFQGVVPKREDAVKVFLAREDDARCLC